MQCYYIQLSLLDSFQTSYFYPSEVFAQNRDPVYGISASKVVALSIINSD